MLLTILKKIPIIQTLFYFPIHCHISAIKKLIFLFILSFSPAIIAILLTPIPAGSVPLYDKLINNVHKAISLTEIYVYIASFITPIFYIIIERYIEIENDNKFKDKVNETIKHLFAGYGLVTSIALILLIITISIFTAAKTNKQYFSTTFLYQFATDFALYLYIYALFCWYISILDSFYTKVDYASNFRSNESDITKKFADRIKRRQD